MTTEFVLLTATVRPNVAIFVSEQDPSTRLAQYQSAIGELLSQVPENTQVLVVETSGAAEDDLLALVPPRARRRVRVEGYDPAASDVSRGKGRVEADAIRHGARAISSDYGLDATIHKLTGRLVLRNAPKVLSPVPVGSARIRMTLDRTYADTRLVSSTAAGWLDVLLADADLVDEEMGVYLEHAVAGAAARASALRQLQVHRFAARPLFVGASGSTGQRYRRGAFGLVPSVSGVVESALAAVAARKQV